jgi:hypothetical protein
VLNYKNNNLVDVKKITLFSVFLFVLSSCANKIPLSSFEQEVPKPAPNYSNMDHWAAHPDKSDYSDLKPKNLLNDTLSLDSVDVFYVYPTLYFDGLEWNADFSNKKSNKKIRSFGTYESSVCFFWFGKYILSLTIGRCIFKDTRII